MAGLRTYRSNRIEVLAEVLGNLVRELPPADPFALVRVTVGGRGMEHWLRHKLADIVGISANLEFPYPQTTFDRLLSGVLDSDAQGHRESDVKTEADPWDPGTLVWAVLEILPDRLASPGFERLAAYARGGHGAVSARELALAREIAGVFDRYVTYRPEIARAWSAGLPAPIPRADLQGLGWQPELWAALHEHLGGAPHRAERLAQAEARLRSGEPVPGLDPQVRIFATSSLAPAWLSFLGALSRHVDIDLFLLCPSDQYWGDVQRKLGSDRSWATMDRDAASIALRGGEGNPLLASMGRVARDFQVVLESQPEGYEDQRVDLFAGAGRAFADFRPDNGGNDGRRALHWLQADLLAARDPRECAADPERALQATDDSLQLHAAHGPTRQVEVLRDVLLGLLDDHPELEPRDIVVMTPDIEIYAPLVSAVFAGGARQRRDGQPADGDDGWGPAGGPRIPFELADRSVRRLNPVADALLRVLALVGGRVEASAVLDLLSLGPVRERFGLDPGDLPTVQAWLHEAGVRWGVDASHRERVGQPADPQNTWRFGLRRLLLGVVMAEDGRRVIGVDDLGQSAEILPFDAMEGADVATLGRTVEFCNTLFGELDALAAPRTVGAWARDLAETVDRMTATDDDTAFLGRRVHDTLDELARSAEDARSRRLVGLDAIWAVVADRFEVQSRGAREQSGAVVFCPMAPMRSVPYRVVCLLGMDDGRFPRQSGGHAFDLTQRRPRIGDHDARDADRYLVIEALMAARDHLVVLYTGRDPRTNEQVPPCVPIAELRDVIDASFPPSPSGAAASVGLTTEHPLQPFSPRAFVSVHRDPRRPGALRSWSFDRRMLAAALSLRQAPGVAARFFPSDTAAPPRPVGGPLRQVTLDELVRFFKNPTEHLVGRRLKIDLKDRAEARADREATALDGLDRWQLRSALLDGRLAGRTVDDVARALRARGTLPLGYAGRSALAREAALVERMLERSGLCGPDGVPEPPEAAALVDIDVGGVRLSGAVGPLRRGMLLDFGFGAEEGKRLVGAWIRLLAWHASSPEAGRAAVILGTERDGVAKVQAVGFDAPEHARATLTELVGLYSAGCDAPVPLFQGASWKYASKGGLEPDDVAEDQVAGLEKALGAAVGAWRAERGDLSDPHVGRVYDGVDPLRDATVGPVPVDRAFARAALTLWRPALAVKRSDEDVQGWLDGGGR